MTADELRIAKSDLETRLSQMTKLYVSEFENGTGFTVGNIEFSQSILFEEGDKPLVRGYNFKIQLEI